MRGSQSQSGPLALISAVGGLLFFLCSTFDSLSALYSLFTSPNGVSALLISIGGFILIMAVICIASYYFDYYLKGKHSTGKTPEPAMPDITTTLDNKVSKSLED